MIGCLTLRLKSEGVLVHQPKSQLVQSVTRTIMVIASFGLTIALFVV